MRADIEQAKTVARRFRLAVVAWSLFDNWREKARTRHGGAASRSGSTHLSLGLAESIAYVDSVFCDYLSCPNVPETLAAGATVLEIGPGDNLGVALRFIAAGADRVVCLDRYFSERDREHERDIYRALRATLSPRGRARFDSAISLDPLMDLNEQRLQYLVGKGIEDASALLKPASFDVIVSRAVLEHTANLDQAFREMDSLLRPGALMVHKVDLRDHGMFSAGGSHPLEFLTIPRWLWIRMTSNSGRPNRGLVDTYRRLLADMEYEAAIRVTHVVGSDHELTPPSAEIRLEADETKTSARSVQRIRHRLAADFKSLPTEDLLTAGILIVARKPGER